MKTEPQPSALRLTFPFLEFCRRGKLRQTGETHAGMPDKQQWSCTGLSFDRLV
jgi:hypothetical protein